MTRLLRATLLTFGAFACVGVGMFAQARINPTDPQPTCEMCPGTYIPLSELDAYTTKAIAEKLVDQLMVRIDPDRVTPLRGEAQSKAYLSKPVANRPVR